VLVASGAATRKLVVESDYFTAFTIGLGPLVRPDQALVAAAFLVALWLIARPGWRLTLAAAGAAAALPVG
jgi:arabinofuranosyltransferase